MQNKTFILNSEFRFKRKDNDEDAFRLMVRGGIVDNWYLPSRYELYAMYDNLHVEGVGGFSNTYYWSSSELNSTAAWIMPFYTGNKDSNGSKGFVDSRVRAIRSFTASEGSYSLREVGPSGGLIFYIDGTTFYEAAPSDQSVSQEWSNIANVLVGTSTAIGTGAANTAAIISQDGHTDSAAKLCNDYIQSTNKLYIDRILTPTGFAGTENVDWEVVDVIYSPAELEKLGKFVIGAKEYDEIAYFIWAELLTEIGIIGETDTDYNLIIRER